MEDKELITNATQLLSELNKVSKAANRVRQMIFDYKSY